MIDRNERYANGIAYYANSLANWTQDVTADVLAAEQQIAEAIAANRFADLGTDQYEAAIRAPVFVAGERKAPGETRNVQKKSARTMAAARMEVIRSRKCAIEREERADHWRDLFMHEAEQQVAGEWAMKPHVRQARINLLYRTRCRAARIEP